MELNQKVFKWINNRINTEDYCLVQLKDHGSERKFFRIHGRDHYSFILMYDSDIEQFNRFLEIHSYLIKVLPTNIPQIYKVFQKEQYVLMRDLGDESFYKKFHNSSMNKREFFIKHSSEAVSLLMILYSHFKNLNDYPPFLSNKDWDYSQSYRRKYEIDYFIDNYCRIHREDSFSENVSKKIFLLVNELEEYLYSTKIKKVFMHRDFQSQNLFFSEGEPFLIDFQSARLGFIEYDIGSLFFDPYLRILNEIELDEWLDESGLSKYFKGKNIIVLSIFRLMQALGAYSNLFYNKGKEFFKEFIKPAETNLIYLIKKSSEFLNYKENSDDFLIDFISSTKN